MDFKNIDNSHFTEKEIIDTNYKVSRYSSFLEYWPQKAIDSIDYVANYDNKIHILSGNANIFNEKKENGILYFDVNNVIDNTFLELPFLFYKGYVVKYKSYDNNKTYIIECTESEHGLVKINLDSNINGYFEVSYHATKLHKICIIISLIFWFYYNNILIINLYIITVANIIKLIFYLYILFNQFYCQKYNF